MNPIPSRWAKPRLLLLAAIALLGLLHLGMLGAVIGRYEMTLHYGQVFRFKTQPVDPYDIFRGRYVTLSFEQETAAGDTQKSPVFRDFPEKRPHSPNGKWVEERKIWVSVATGADGFAEITGWSLTPPKGDRAKGNNVKGNNVKGDHVFEVEAWLTSPHYNEGEDENGSKKSRNVRLEFPFRRFYMEESAAPKAEAAYRRANRASRESEAANAEAAHAAQEPGAKARPPETCALVRIRGGLALLEDLVIDGQPVRELTRASGAAR